VGELRYWTSADKTFAAAAAEAAAAALEARAREEARQGMVRARFLDHASRALSGTLDLPEVGRRAMALVVPRFADVAIIDLVEPEGTVRLALEVFTPEGRALLESAIPTRAKFNGGRYVAERIVARRDAILVPDVNEEAYREAALQGLAPEVLAAVRSLGARSHIAAPLLVGDRIAGVLQLMTCTRRYGVEDLKLVEELARRLAPAIENARLHQHLQVALRSRDELVALAGRELRAPLESLRLTARELVESAATAPRERIEGLGAALVERIERFDRLSMQTLAATRIWTGGVSPARAPTDLVAIVRGTVQAFEPYLRRCGCPATVRADGKLIGEWDGAQLELAISNLVDNAARFGAGRPIELSVEREDEDAVLRVSDHGAGIEPDAVARIFEPFERAILVQEEGRPGMGLLVTRAIVEGHGGRLIVEGHPGQGTTFTVRLPLKAR
jgi:signal transduction histidine kinase